MLRTEGSSLKLYFIFIMYLFLSHGLQLLGLTLAVIFHDHHGCIDFTNCQVSSWRMRKAKRKLKIVVVSFFLGSNYRCSLFSNLSTAFFTTGTHYPAEHVQKDSDLWSSGTGAHWNIWGQHGRLRLLLSKLLPWNTPSCSASRGLIDSEICFHK